MHAPSREMPLSLSPILPPSLRRWTEPIEPALFRMLVPERLSDAFESVRQTGTSGEFARRLLDHLNIRFAVDDRDRARVPALGAAIAVANHPFGFVEGLVLAALFDEVRPDFKILANSLLGGIVAMRDHLILVNPFETRGSRTSNVAPLRAATQWLSSGRLLAVFPGGEVASLNWKERTVTDPQWKTTAARLALRARCPVLPMFFLGGNSVPFQLAGCLHPSLRTVSLPREFDKLSGKTIHLRIGNPIPAGVLAGYQDAAHATEYMRSRSFFLTNRTDAGAFRPVAPSRPACTPVVRREGELSLTEEVAALPPEYALCGNQDFTVYLAPATAIPRLLEEIGRCREVAFRGAGEGSGKASDLDRFDHHYQHLFLWSRTDSRLAGGYRLAVTTDTLPRFGIAGLYTSTLFRIDRRFFESIGPAMELGRSFIMPEYQKSYAPLLLLWKGISRAVQRRPEAPVLFGAVSISNTYRAASRGLMVNYLAATASHELARLVRPRKQFRDPAARNGQIRRFARLAADIEDVSISISDIEDDAKGVPVLLRQYLKAGGKILAFNLDPSFADVLDALVVADLRTAPLPLLERCMGPIEARAFLNLHGRLPKGK